jgi:four helix bundle protein
LTLTLTLTYACDIDGAVDLDATVVVYLDVDDPRHATQPHVRRYITMLSFQRLEVYQRAIEFLAFTFELLEQLPRGHNHQADQLGRAAESVPRNIAEGAGRWSKIDVAKHYKIARGEAMECAASLDVFRARGLIDEAQYARGTALLEGVVAMLTKMVYSAT